MTAVPAKELRPYVLAAEQTSGADQLRALAKVQDQAQQLEDRLLLEILDTSTAAELARNLGISPQAVSYRKQHAQRRRGGGS